MDARADAKEYLAAIVESSDDAIVTKNLNSIIQTWNKGAERLFGYTEAEAIGRPIMMIIPEDRLHEEVGIIARLKRGERVDHFETIRKRKDGSLVPISLTISPVRNAAGEVIGASKIARDISLQRKAAERQRQLLAEMRHRVGNCFAVAGSLITVTARQAKSAEELAEVMRNRLMALSAAHRLALPDPSGESQASASLQELMETILNPFVDERECEMEIEDVRIAPNSITALALIFYELCTNAAKYGALGQADGRITVRAARKGDRYVIDWQEHCRIDPETSRGEGFGTRLCQDVAKTSLGGSIARVFEPTGLRAQIDLDPETFLL